MFDKIEDRIIRTQINILKKQKLQLNEKLTTIEKNIMDLENYCPHNLILCYFESATYPKSRKQANCLICGTSLELEDNFELFSEKIIADELIIDITDKVSLHSQTLYKGNTNIMVLKAEEIIKDIMYDSYIRTINEIKEILITQLIEYDKELTGKKLIKRNDRNE